MRDMEPKQPEDYTSAEKWLKKSTARTRALEAELRMAKIKFETLSEYLNDVHGLDGSLVVICDDASADIERLLAYADNPDGKVCSVCLGSGNDHCEPSGECEACYGTGVAPSA